MIHNLDNEDLLDVGLDEKNNGYRPITTNARSGFRSGRNVGSRGNKDQSGLLYHLQYRETCAPVSSEYAQRTTFGLSVEASLFSLTGWFHIHLFLLIIYKVWDGFSQKGLEQF